MAQYDVTHVANIEASGVAAQSFLYYVSGRERDTRWETSKLQGGHHCLKPAEAKENTETVFDTMMKMRV
jgi:hypothetical protein